MNNSPPPAYYSGPGGSSKVPNQGFQPLRMLDPNNVTGMSNKGNAPPTDFGAAADAQGKSNQQAMQQQTQANRPNQQTGFGGVQWTQDANGNWSQNASLNPALSGALSSLQGQAQANASHPMDNGSAARDQSINAAYGQATSRLNPQWQQSDEQLGAQLANQGLDPNSQAYRTAMQQHAFDKNDAYSSAMNNAIAQGTAAQQATFGENMAAQMAPYQQMSSLQGFQNGVPGFAAAGNYGGTPYLQGAEASAGMLQQQNAANQQASADTMGAGMGAMSSWMGGGASKGAQTSDERVKTDVKRLSVEVEPGIPLATYRYKHAPEKGHMLGVIAQDVEKVRPDAVQTNEAGIKSVDYSKLKPFGIK